MEPKHRSFAMSQCREQGLNPHEIINRGHEALPRYQFVARELAEQDAQHRNKEYHK